MALGAVGGLVKGSARRFWVEWAERPHGAIQAIGSAARLLLIPFAHQGQDGVEGNAVNADAGAGQGQEFRLVAIDAPAQDRQIESAQAGEGVEKEI